MKFTALLASFALALVSVAAPATYEIDGSHSSITFSAKTLFTPVHGSFLIESGTLVFDERNLEASSVVATIPIASVDTRDKTRDKNILTKPEWFAETLHPKATFKSTRWKKDGDAYLIDGELSLNGKTLPVTLTATLIGTGPGLQPGSTVIGWEARTTLDRAAFGITADTRIIERQIPIVISIQGNLRTSS